MSERRRIVVLTSALAFNTGCSSSAPTAAQHSPPRALVCDALAPRWSHLATSYGYLEHDAAIGTTLFSQVPVRSPTNIATAEELLIAMVRQRPGYPEDAVYVLRQPPSTAVQPRYRVIHASAKDFLTTREASPGAKFSEAAADPEMVQILENVWAGMTLSARWQTEPPASRQLGGAWYAFAYHRDMVIAEGETVSPSAESCSGVLVEVGGLLSQFADATESTTRAAIREQILRRGADLARRVSGTSKAATSGTND